MRSIAYTILKSFPNTISSGNQVFFSTTEGRNRLTSRCIFFFFPWSSENLDFLTELHPASLILDGNLKERPTRVFVEGLPTWSRSFQSETHLWLTPEEYICGEVEKILRNHWSLFLWMLLAAFPKHIAAVVVVHHTKTLLCIIFEHCHETYQNFAQEHFQRWESPSRSLFSSSWCS